MKSTSTSFLPFHLPLIEEADIQAVCEVLKSGWITTGPKVCQFEDEFARFVGAPHAVSVNSGTAALHVALDAVGLKEGDEVLVPTLTFAATAEAVLYFKARPILIDSEPDTLNIDPAQVERAITPRTKAIIPVHFAGHPCEMTQLLEIAHEHDLKVIEDAAHALPARYRGRMIGTLGDITCFSFYATKNITTGEGGMATTENNEYAERMRMMRLHGISKDAWKRYSAEGSWRYEILAPGFKYNLTDFQAAMGITQLARCDAMLERRNVLARRYTDALDRLDAFELPTVRSDVQHAWHLYVIRMNSKALNIHRDQVIEELRQRNIGVSVHFIPLHTHPYYRKTWSYRDGDFPVTEDYFDRCISLPLYPAMSDDDQARVIDALAAIASSHRRSSEYTRSPSWMHSTPANQKIDIEQPQLQRSAHDLPLNVETTLREPTVRSLIFRAWYSRVGKRIFDVLFSCVSLLVLSPVLLVCAIAVRLSSPGPIYFWQTRIGRGGRPFKLIKFRTMIQGSENLGPRITGDGDARITAIGRWLRKLKGDELPQLFNVLKGEMSVIGPRPEVPEYVVSYTGEQREVLTLRPGMTGVASLTYIDEEKVLATHPDKEAFYISVLIPHKLSLELAYCRNVSLSNDIRLILATIGCLLHFEAKPPVQTIIPNQSAVTDR